jgi:tetratricopeptide (TPR) repeat protein
MSAVPVPALSGHRRTIRRRARETFVGRRREMAKVLDLLLPLPAGVQRPGAFEPRIVTLVREGGIGKTSLAAELADWMAERELFLQGVFEVPCEYVREPAELLIRLLDLFGVEPELRRGDLHALLRDAIAARLGEFGALLFIDNLDDLTAKDRAAIRRETLDLLEAVLDAAPGLRVLATCRWPLGLSEREATYEVPPLSDDDALTVFRAHLRNDEQVDQAGRDWQQNPDGPTRRLVRLAGRNPQCLQLLACQLRRPGMTLERLRQEAEADLLRALQDPYSDDNELDRLRRLDVSCELSYRHLSSAARTLFQWLSFLPGGVWAGEVADVFIPWHLLLGDDWRRVMDSELVYFALARYEEEPSSSVTYLLAPPILEFARRKYDAVPDLTWERRWAEFWRARVSDWDARGRTYLFDDGRVPDEQRPDVEFRFERAVMDVLTRTQPNWMRAHDHCLRHAPPAAATFVLKVAQYCDLMGQSSLLASMARQTIEALRPLDAPLQLAECLTTYSLALEKIGRQDEARPAYEEAIGIARARVDTDPSGWKPVLGRALLNLAGNLLKQDDLAGARFPQQEACDIFRSLADTDPDTYLSFLATALSNLAVVASREGNHDEARRRNAEALSIFERLMQKQFAAHAPEAARILCNLAIGMSNDHQAALKAYEKAISIYRRLAADYPKAYEDRLAWALAGRGVALRESGQPEAARQAFHESLAIRRRLALDEPGRHNPDLAQTLYNLGNALRDLRAEAEAIKVSQEAIAIYQSLGRSARTEDELLLAQTLVLLGSVWQDSRERHDPAAARTAFEEAIRICRGLRQRSEGVESERELANALHNLGLVHRCDWEQRNLPAARQAFEEAAAIRGRLAAVDADAYEPNLAKTFANLEEVLRELGETDLARQAYEAELNVRRRLALRRPEMHEPDLALALYAHGRILFDLKQYEAARALFQEVLDLDRRLAPSSPDGESNLAETLDGLARCQVMLHDWGAARLALDEELPIRRRVAEEDPIRHGPRLAEALYRRGIALKVLGDPAAAMIDFTEALVLIESHDQLSENERQLFTSILDNYVKVTPRDERDHWWKLWEARNSTTGSDSLPETSSQADRP